MIIPFFDLKGQYTSIKNLLDETLEMSIQNAHYVRGEDVYTFERAWGDLLKCEVVTTANGTDSLFIALKSLNVRAGDEVITPAFTWISSAETISLCHARPVFTDIDSKDYTLNPALIEDKITSKTKGVITTHLYGQSSHLNAIKSICDNHGIFLIEDCAQGHLTSENNEYAGTVGQIGTFSFYPTKNLGAYGDAGCVVTKDSELAEKMRRFANHGALQKDDHLFEGMNSRMDTIQAAILNTKLPYLAKWTDQRIKNAAIYNILLADVEEITLPFVRPNTVHTHHIYAIQAKRRDQLKEFLNSRGVQTMIHYPIALPNTPAYRYLAHIPDDFPVASRLQEKVLSLPIYPELTEDQIRYICKNIKDFYAQKGV
jgi:dTDP-4-amino-4,6-dideoxygalactose transaminase